MWLIGIKSLLLSLLCVIETACAGDTCFDAAAPLFDAEGPTLQLGFSNLWGDCFLMVEWREVDSEWGGGIVVWKVMAEEQHS